MGYYIFRKKELMKQLEQVDDNDFIMVQMGGHTAPKCRECQCKHWTYKEPVKCACWCLKEVDVPTKVTIPIEEAMKFYKTKYITIK